MSAAVFNLSKLSRAGRDSVQVLDLKLPPSKLGIWSVCFWSWWKWNLSFVVVERFEQKERNKLKCLLKKWNSFRAPFWITQEAWQWPQEAQNHYIVIILKLIFHNFGFPHFQWFPWFCKAVYTQYYTVDMALLISC